MGCLDDATAESSQQCALVPNFNVKISGILFSDEWRTSIKLDGNAFLMQPKSTDRSKFALATLKTCTIQLNSIYGGAYNRRSVSMEDYVSVSSTSLPNTKP